MKQLGLLIKLVDSDDSHSLQPLFERVVRFGFKTCQISNNVPGLYTSKNADWINWFCRKNGLKVTMLWAGWPGKTKWNFVDGPGTVGLVPLRYREERAAIMKSASNFAKLLDVDCIATHVGFIPENPSDPLYGGLIDTLRDIAEYCKNNGQCFCFETGQETPVTLLRTIEDIGAENLGVNLDPANLVMYGKGNPVDSLKVLGKFIRGVHVKDGKYPTDGKELGIEVPIGSGDLDMPQFLAELDTLGYAGAYTIEIELDRRHGEMSLTEAIVQAKQYLQRHL